MVGFDAQVNTQVNFQVGFGRAYLATLAAHPFRLLQVNGGHVVIEIGKVGKELVTVFAYGHVIAVFLF